MNEKWNRDPLLPFAFGFRKTNSLLVGESTKSTSHPDKLSEEQGEKR